MAIGQRDRDGEKPDMRLVTRNQARTHILGKKEFRFNLIGTGEVQNPQE